MSGMFVIHEMKSGLGYMYVHEEGKALSPPHFLAVDVRTRAGKEQAINTRNSYLAGSTSAGAAMYITYHVPTSRYTASLPTALILQAHHP
jgi:hypothetical protein